MKNPKTFTILGSFLHEIKPGQPVSRILSGGDTTWMAIYLDRQLPADSSGLPGDDWDPGKSRRERLLSCLTLHRMGVTWPYSLLYTPVVSYTTISPLPC